MVIKFEVFRGRKCWCARALGESIFTQGRTLDELTANINEAAALHFEGRLHKNEPLTILTLMEKTLPYAKVAAN